MASDMIMGILQGLANAQKQKQGQQQEQQRQNTPFDPMAGLTPEVIELINRGFGTASGKSPSGSTITLGNTRGASSLPQEPVLAAEDILERKRQKDTQNQGPGFIENIVNIAQGLFPKKEESTKKATPIATKAAPLVEDLPTTEDQASILDEATKQGLTIIGTDPLGRPIINESGTDYSIVGFDEDGELLVEPLTKQTPGATDNVVTALGA